MSASLKSRRDSRHDSDEEGAAPSKRRRTSQDDVLFKQQMQTTLKKLSGAAPNSFAVSRRVNAPMTTITIKNTQSIVHFPVYESKVAEVVQLMEQSPDGKVQKNNAGVINSWELNSGGFEISNPAWNDFIDNELVPMIKEEMFVDFSFRPTLYKLVLYKAGSYFQSIEHLENIDGMFGKLVIQLPSVYKGGQFELSRDGKPIMSDFSSANRSNTFSTFFTAFYWYCDSSMSLITEGYRVCLIYHLISRPSLIPTFPRQHALEPALLNLIRNWEYRGKLVYALKHKYSESDLTFDNLKATDRSIANFLVYIAKETDLAVYLAIFNKESSGQSTATNFSFDSDDEDSSRWKSYSISKLIAIDGTNLLTTSLTVKFDAEVITEDCFNNIAPYRKKLKLNGGAIDVTRFHSSAAIVFWPKRFLLEVPKKCGASSADLDKIFLKEIDTYRGNVKEDTVEAKLKNWAKEIVSLRGNKSIDVIKAIVEMKDIPLIQSLFSNCVMLNEVSLSLAIDVCEKYGWKTFADQVPEMFRKLSKKDGIELLGRIGIADMDEDKKSIVHKSMQTILNKSLFSSYMDEQNRLKEQDFFLSACRLAEKLDFEMFNVAKDKSMLLIVPVLLRLVPNNSQKLPPFWNNVALHFVQEMLKALFKPVLNWRRNDRANCSCIDCSPLNAFLASDQVEISFRMGKQRRDHLKQFLFQMPNITHQTNHRTNNGILVIRKISENLPEDAEKRSFSMGNINTLLAILPR
ncbi:hypothetical protein HA402_009254 [Bradysia odoriphaga]|nr:hypothetical protein HA402_009254 [Bradysia odoriphaga]